MSEEKNEKNTVSDAENTQNAPEIEDKEELITADSLDKMMEELKEEADGSVQTPPVKAEKPAVTETSENVKKYKLFFVSDIRDPEQYVENYKEAGWDNIYHEKGEFDGVWNYFRTEMDDGTEPKIFSDRMSRIALYKRLLTSWRSLLTMLAICSVFILGLLAFLWLGVNASSITTIGMRVSGIILLLILAVFLLYLRLYHKIGRKLEELVKH